MCLINECVTPTIPVMDDARVGEPPPLERGYRRPATSRGLSGAEQGSQSTLGNDRFLQAIDSLLSSSLTYLLWLLRLLIPGTVISS